MRKISKKSFIITIALVVVVVGYFYGRTILLAIYGTTETSLPLGKTLETLSHDNLNKQIQVIATNLNVPWDVAFLPSGEMLVMERPGRLMRFGKDKQSYEIKGVKETSEGGLLGIAVHPKFPENKWIYLYFTTKIDSILQNRVVRYSLATDSLQDEKIVINNIPAGKNHDGGRIAFGPDGYLYVATGDAMVASLAQDTSSLAGKFLRVTDEGAIPSDNPFKNAVYSYGHRNPQGITWDKEGRLWATEHGSLGYDELNIIEKGKNYGWPIIEGDEAREGMERPIFHSGKDETWAPSGVAYLDGSIFFSGLRSQSLYEVKTKEVGKASFRVHFREDFGRIRAVVVGPDGFLYFSTSNTDGRGDPSADDDKIYRISTSTLN